MTPLEKKEVFYYGGRRRSVKLCGRDIVIGEAALKDLPKIYGCLEGDAAELERITSEYVGNKPKGLRRLFGMFRKKERPAVSMIRELVEGVTKNDYRLVSLSALPFNEITEAEFKRLFWNAPNSEVQEAVRASLDVNGIDLKKMMAARVNQPGSLAAWMTGSSAGSPGSLNTPDGPGQKY